MKKMNRFLALAMALVMLLALCACGEGGTRSISPPDFETRMRQAQENMAKLESMHMEMSMDMSLEMSVLGQTQPMDMRVYYTMDTQNEPARTKLVITISSMGQSQEQVMYTDESGMIYMQLDGRSWQRQSAQGSSQANEMQPDQMLQLFLNSAGSFRETGSETINGSKATVYSGVLGGDYVKQVLETTGLGSTLGEALGTGDAGNLFDNLGEIPMTVAIDDESGLVVRYTMDMAQVMENLMKNLFNSMLTSQGLNGVEIEIKISNCMATATLSQFNSVPEIVIPAEAKG
ncbi:MAG: hypothetical protein IJK63_05465 [Oscillospiraceae bacterium]|nr:hypothetical protein [Oscillospiraceae bacterium]